MYRFSPLLPIENLLIHDYLSEQVGKMLFNEDITEFVFL